MTQLITALSVAGKRVNQIFGDKNTNVQIKSKTGVKINNNLFFLLIIIFFNTS